MRRQWDQDLAEKQAEQNEQSAISLHQKAAKQARIYDEDVAEQTKISAQVLDNCGVEARSIAAAIRALGEKV